MLAPLLDDDLGLLQAVEDFSVEKFIAQLAVEAFHEGVLLRFAQRDVVPFDLGLLRPWQHRHTSHFRAVVGSDVFWNTPGEHDIGHGLDDAEAVDSPGNSDGQALSGKLVDQRQQSDLAAIMGLGFDKVIGPDMVAPFRP